MKPKNMAQLHDAMTIIGRSPHCSVCLEVHSGKHIEGRQGLLVLQAKIASHCPRVLRKGVAAGGI